MKKIIGIVMAFILVLPFGCTTIARAESDNEYQVRINELEREIAEYKAQIDMYEGMVNDFLILIDQISNGDINNDGYTNAVDASQLLSYYAYLSTGGTNTLRKFLLEHDMYK